MRVRRSSYLAAASVVIATMSAACTGPSALHDGGALEDAGADAGTASDARITAPDAGPLPTRGLEDFTCPGATIAPGENRIMVGSRERVFYADFPADPTREMGVLFSWHGFGDTMAHHRDASALDPDGDPALPVIVITPDDAGLPIPMGLDWDIRAGDAANIDLQFFEAMLGCLNEQFDLDAQRIYSFGFSAGSVMTALLHSRYPALLSAVVCVSGAWFNDEAEAMMVRLFRIDWEWPPLDAADGGAVLLTHGGPTDVTVFDVLDLESSAQAAIPFLLEHGRVVVDCAHTSGHTLDPDLTPAHISRFLSAHRAGAPSPYLSGGFEGFPDACTLRTP